jgi:hypothetical protein
VFCMVDKRKRFTGMLTNGTMSLLISVRGPTS